jgi:hypothetical protein
MNTLLLLLLLLLFKWWKFPMITCGLLYGLIKEKFLLSFCWNPSWLINPNSSHGHYDKFWLKFWLVLLVFKFLWFICHLFWIRKSSLNFFLLNLSFHTWYIPCMFLTCFSGRQLAHLVFIFLVHLPTNKSTNLFSQIQLQGGSWVIFGF